MNTTEHKATRLLQAQKLEDLSNSLFLSKKKLRELIQYPAYRTFEIPKKKGGWRQICAPDPELLKVQKRMNRLLQVLYTEHRDIHGFINGEGRFCRHDIYANASMHIGKKFVWNIDLQEFFPSISTTQIKEVFVQAPFGFKEPLAAYFALLFCFRKQLPAGAPSSPMFSNFVCRGLDKDIRLWVEELNRDATINLTYSRYADDCTFSYDAPLPDSNKLELFAIIRNHGFELNQKKNREQTHLQSQWVTGIKVNEKPNIDRRTIRNLRAILYNIKTQGFSKAASRYLKLTEEADGVQIGRFMSSLKGKIIFVGYVRGQEDEVFLKLFSEFNKVEKGFLVLFGEE